MKLAQMHNSGVNVLKLNYLYQKVKETMLCSVKLWGYTIYETIFSPTLVIIWNLLINAY